MHNGSKKRDDCDVHSDTALSCQDLDMSSLSGRLDCIAAHILPILYTTLRGNGTTCEKSLVYRQGSQAKSPLPYGIGVVSYIPDDTTSYGDLPIDHGPLTRRLVPVRSIRPRHRIVLVSQSFVVLSYQYLLLY